MTSSNPAMCFSLRKNRTTASPTWHNEHWRTESELINIPEFPKLPRSNASLATRFSACWSLWPGQEFLNNQTDFSVCSMRSRSSLEHDFRKCMSAPAASRAQMPCKLARHTIQCESEVVPIVCKLVGVSADIEALFLAGRLRNGDGWWGLFGTILSNKVGHVTTGTTTSRI